MQMVSVARVSPCGLPVRRFMQAVMAFGVLALLGCQAGPGTSYVKPTIAVLRFDNKAPIPFQWDLGGGTKDILTDRLVKTDRFHVIERPDIESVMREIHLENTGQTREQDRAKVGQLKNVQYLIKGTITDFGQIGGVNGFAAAKGTVISGASSTAVMGMTLYVIDVQSGEVIASQRIQESVSAGNIDFQSAYKDVAFGGGIFAQTPLGQATTHAIDRAVGKITESIARTPWQPKIATVDGDRQVVLNGGRERGLKVGQEFEVLAPPVAVVDPDTGDVIARKPGRPLGHIKVVEVEAASATAAVTAGGELKVGAICAFVERK